MSSRIYKDDGTSQAECIHGIIYRKALGESCKYENVVGEGFGVIAGKLKVFSGAFNLAKDNDLYQDDSAYTNCQLDVWNQWLSFGSYILTSPKGRIILHAVVL